MTKEIWKKTWIWGSPSHVSPLPPKKSSKLSHRTLVSFPLSFFFKVLLPLSLGSLCLNWKRLQATCGLLVYISPFVIFCIIVQRNIIFYYYITLYHIHTPTQTHFSLISLYINSPSQFSLSCFLPFTSLIKKFPSLFLSLPLSHGRPSNRLLHVRWRWFPRQAFPLQQMPPPFPTLVCLISFLHHHHHIIKVICFYSKCTLTYVF